MTTLKRRMAAVFAAALLAGSVAPGAALAGGYCPPPPDTRINCNAGRGNGSEGCDPGRSSTSPNGSTGQNQGGDEGGPFRGGTGV